MESIYKNKGDIQTVNTSNNCAIAALTDDGVIEVNCVITKDGPKPIAIGALPNTIKGITLGMKAFEELVIQASISGDYNDAYRAFLMNPLLADETLSKR